MTLAIRNCTLKNIESAIGKIKIIMISFDYEF